MGAQWRQQLSLQKREMSVLAEWYAKVIPHHDWRAQDSRFAWNVYFRCFLDYAEVRTRFYRACRIVLA